MLDVLEFEENYIKIDTKIDECLCVFDEKSLFFEILAENIFLKTKVAKRHLCERCKGEQIV